ncbi:hypothetical protein [Couchioplanes azureus]|uniref:hypothetical protein n=1 Tax=Couchioplanes caeruleus TaxID=56438 RepID=UPI001E2D32DC|nr:hypothetical protein [Couchioplanes caeruleus]
MPRFAAVHHCVRSAPAERGRPPAPILPGRRAAPRWPDAVVVGMTHCAGQQAAALAGCRRTR